MTGLFVTWRSSSAALPKEVNTMAINMIPEFTADESVATGIEEVKQTVPSTEETETPTELPADQEEILEEKPAIDEGQPQHRDDTTDLTRQVEGLQNERIKLLKELQELRGERRNLKQDELLKVDQKIDDLKDVNPEDVALIDKVLRSKGYLTKEESQKMFYESVKQEEINKFVEKFPEYHPSNDPNDINWNALQRELSYYRLPDDPRRLGEILMRAHGAIAKAPSDRNVEIKRQQVRTASVGSGGVQRSSSKKTLSPEQRAIYERGGWSAEDIQKIEEKL